MYVVDASVYVADMRPSEPHHPEARAFLDQVRSDGDPAYGPIIVLAEVAAGISRGTGRPGLARRLTGLLRRVPNFIFVPVDEALGQQAAEIAAGRQIRGCDSVYVALAQRLGATLITLDGEQRQRAPAAVLAQTPSEALSVLAARNAGRSGPSH
jgi:predicted nucleic acid-binding protein